MRLFLDTSVMIAAYLEENQNHERCRRLLLESRPETTACSSHSMAEFYSAVTRLPRRLRLSVEQAWLLIEEIRGRLTPIALTAEEHYHELKRATENGIKGGTVYDALLLGCARKHRSDRIYTLNTRHFRSVAPDLADRIVTP